MAGRPCEPKKRGAGAEAAGWCITPHLCSSPPASCYSKVGWRTTMADKCGLVKDPGSRIGYKLQQKLGLIYSFQCRSVDALLKIWQNIPVKGNILDSKTEKLSPTFM